jgi:hypothetical protein
MSEKPFSSSSEGQPRTRDMRAEEAEILRLKFQDGERSGRREAATAVLLEAGGIARLVSNEGESGAVLEALNDLATRLSK